MGISMGCVSEVLVGLLTPAMGPVVASVCWAKLSENFYLVTGLFKK